MTAANGWEIDDSSLIEIAQLPFSDLVSRASQQDVAALNHLYRTYTRSILHKKAAKVCSRLSHLGEKCLESETPFEHAFDASVQYGIEKVFGFSPTSKSENISVALRGQFSPSDVYGFSESRASALKQVMNHIQSIESAGDDALVTSWGHQVHIVTKKGFVDESRRRWNTSRQLAQRIDQKSYFVKQTQKNGSQSEDLHTDLFKRFTENWNDHVTKLQNADNPQAMNVLKLLSSMRIDISSPEGLLVFLRVVYFDACENTYADNYPIDELRMLRSFINFDILDKEVINDIAPDSITSLVVLVEECLRLSYSKPDIEHQAILHNLQMARNATRIFESLGRKESVDLSMFDGEDNTDIFHFYDEDEIVLEEL